jgi:hypothetical protein
MKLKMSFVCLFVVATFLAVVSTNAQSINADFQEAVTAYQQSHSVVAAEKVIGLAAQMDQPPAIPAEAKKHMSRGAAAVEEAKTEDDFKDAAAEFQMALNAAPWLADGYRNIAIVQDKAGLYEAALANLKLYLLTKPSPSDVEWAEDRQNKIEYRRDKAAKEAEAKAKESSPQAVAAKKQNEYDAWLKELDGRRYTRIEPTHNGASYAGWSITTVVDVRGKYLVCGMIYPQDVQKFSPRMNPGYIETTRYEIRGRETPIIYYVDVLQGDNFVKGARSATYIISEDGDKITLRSPDGEITYLLQR